MSGTKRGRYLLTVKSIKPVTVKQGLYETESWEYIFESDDGTRYRYFGQCYAIFIGKRYEVIATNHGVSYGAIQLKRPRFTLAGLETELFERD